VIPHGGVEQLTSNFFIRSLVEAKTASMDKQSERVLCEVCCDDDDLSSSNIPNATMYCKNCGQKLCSQCSKGHKKIPGGAHEVVAFGSNMKEDLLKLQGSFCSLHSGNKIEIYCSDCHLNTCVTCHALKHRTHDCHDINDMCQKFSETLKADVERVTGKESSIAQEIKRLELAQNQYHKKIQDIENALLQNATELKKRIDEAVNQLMKELSDNKTAASKVVSEMKNQLEFAAAASRSFSRYSRELLGKGKACDVTRAYKELHERAGELLKRDVMATGCDLPKVVVSASDIFDTVSQFIREKSKPTSGYFTDKSTCE
jgi:hypothetical protein